MILQKINLNWSSIASYLERINLKEIFNKYKESDGIDKKRIWFEKLTPVDNVELNIYKEALDFIFENEDIKNVAISGAYSSGKSSVLETYKKIRKDLRFINISLTHFESVDGQNSNSTESSTIKNSEKYSETVLEGKILNQLIHKVDPKKIPQTNFKIKRKIPNWRMVVKAISATLFLVSLVYIRYFDSWADFVLKLSNEKLVNFLKLTTTSEGLLVSGIYCVVYIGVAIYFIIKAQLNKNIFRRVKTKPLDLEIEIFAQSEESYFDKHLNEVLYLFENSGADVIVFEDMDRYNSNLIFEKLREINTLVNNKYSRKRKKKLIRFFYLLKDDIFVSKDRTKFFDFIIPIVPVMDASNSFDKFIELFKKGGIYELFDEDFLRGLSLYIDDMRILKNIYNEFIIYHGRIQATDLTCNKLLAIITYKNLFPRDFNNLQLGMGFVHTLFQHKNQLIKQETENIENQIRELENEIRKSENEYLKSIDELDAAFLLTNYQFSAVGNTSASQFKTRAELIKAIKDNKANAYKLDYYNRQVPINLEQEFNKLQNNPDYVKRRDIITARYNGEIEKKKKELQDLKKQKTIIENKQLKDFITRENIDLIFNNVNFNNGIGKPDEFKEIKGSPYFDLIKYLIRNGYIDETYPDYMTYFYEQSISRIDKIFLRSITDQRHKGYSYKLQDPSKILKWLRIVDFDCEEILNFDLLCYLIETQEENKRYLDRFLQQLKDRTNIRFIREFLFDYDFAQKMRGPIIDVFVRSINSLWPEIFRYILSEDVFNEHEIREYISYTFYSSTEEDIKKLNEDNCLTEYISNQHAFLNHKYSNIKRIIDMFVYLGVKFKWIDDINEVDSELLDGVYRHNLYEINFHMVKTMLKRYYDENFEESDFYKKNYTLVISRPQEPLAIYVKENINDYITVILENCSDIIEDNEFAVLEILNNSDVNYENKEEYIELLGTKIQNIQNVDDRDLWRLLLRNNLIRYSAANILSYFFETENGLDTYLIQFINKNDEDLDFDTEMIENQYGESAVLTFFNAIVKCNELYNERYEHILQRIHIDNYKFTHTGIQNEKVLILIELGIIQMSTTELLFMRKNYKEHLMYFITKNITEYIEIVKDSKYFSIDELLAILNENIDDNYKIMLLQLTSEKISIIDIECSDKVKGNILEHNLNEKDIPYLLESYSQKSEYLRAKIKQIAIEHIDEIIENKYSICRELLLEIFASEDLEEDTKKRLLVNFIRDADVNTIQEYLTVIKLEDFLGLFYGKRPKIKKSDVNRFILDIYKDREWITKYEDDIEKGYYRAYGRRILRNSRYQ